MLRVSRTNYVLPQVTLVTLLAKKAFQYDNKAFIVKMVVICHVHVV